MRQGEEVMMDIEVANVQIREGAERNWIEDCSCLSSSMMCVWQQLVKSNKGCE